MDLFISDTFAYIGEQIFSYLNYADLWKCRFVCPTWNEFLQKNAHKIDFCPHWLTQDWIALEEKVAKSDEDTQIVYREILQGHIAAQKREKVAWKREWTPLEFAISTKNVDFVNLLSRFVHPVTLVETLRLITSCNIDVSEVVEKLVLSSNQRIRLMEICAEEDHLDFLRILSDNQDFPHFQLLKMIVLHGANGKFCLRHYLKTCALQDLEQTNESGQTLLEMAQNKRNAYLGRIYAQAIQEKMEDFAKE